MASRKRVKIDMDCLIDDTFFNDDSTIESYIGDCGLMDFTDLDSEEDKSIKHMIYLAATLIVFLSITVSMFWFIQNNIATRQSENGRTVFNELHTDIMASTPSTDQPIKFADLGL